MNRDAEAMIPPKTVLVAGVGRSGTSWLGKILDSSPQVFYKPQPDDVNRYPWFRGIPSRLDPTPEFDRFREPFARALHQMFSSHSVYLRARPDFRKAFLYNGAWRALNLGLRAWCKATRGGGPVVRIPRWIFRSDPRNVTFVLKSVVSNMRLAWIHRHFPQIKIILIVRHPGGYLNSVFRGARDHRWRNIGTRKRLEGVVLPFRHREHQKYASVIENGSESERELIYCIVANETPILELGNSPSFKLVVYEELCARPMEVARQIFTFLDLPFSETTAEFLSDSTSHEHSGYYAVYKDSSRAATKWREELSEEHATLVGEYLQRCSLATLWKSKAGALGGRAGGARS